MLNLKNFPLRSQSQKSADCSFFFNGRCAENCGQKWQNSPKTTKKVAIQLLKLKLGVACPGVVYSLGLLYNKHIPT